MDYKNSNIKSMLHKCIGDLENILVYMQSNVLEPNKEDLEQLKRDQADDSAKEEMILDDDLPKEE